MDRIFKFVRQKKSRETSAEREYGSVGRHNSMRLEKGRITWNLLAITIKARTVVEPGGGGGSLLSDPGSELCLESRI